MSGSGPGTPSQHDVATSAVPVAVGVDTLDYATPRRADPRQRLTLVQLARRCGLIACVLLALSLAIYDGDELGWSGEGRAGAYRVQARQLAIGFPLPWLTWNSVSASGKPPALSQLPEGHRFRPGIHVNALALLLAIGLAIPSAILIQALVARIRWRGRFLFGWYGLAFLTLCAISMGASAEFCAGQRTSDTPLIVALLLGLAVVLIVAWPDSGYGSAIIAAGVASLGIWWGMCLGHPLANPQSAGDSPRIGQVLGWFLLYLLPVFAFVAARRILATVWKPERTT